MKKRTVLARLALLGAALGGLVLAGCSFTTAELSEATMCLSVDSLSQPVDPTDTFGVNTPEIFCSVKLSNAPEDTEVLSEWVYVKGEVAGVTDYVIDTLSLTTDGTRYLQFSLGIPDGGWPVGEYKLVLYVDGKEKVSLPFTVSASAILPGGASLSEATMALGVDANSKPVNPTTTFDSRTPEIFCSVLVSNAPAGTQVLSEWYYVSGELQGVTNMLIDSFPLAVEGTQYIQFSLPIGPEGWPAGQYRLKLYLNGAPEEALSFTINPAPITATMAMNIDANNQPVNPTTTFPAGVEKVWTVVFINDVAPGTKLLVEWYEVGGAVDAYINKYE
ncbi:MAG: hypothetical protein E4G93_02655, partial [Dehalococcoidia bacterium]